MLPRRNTLVDALRDGNATARTENGAAAFTTTNSRVLDFYAQMGAIRTSRTPGAMNRLTEMFMAAYTENSDLAIRALLYLRDIRGGLGEREAFRTILMALSQSLPQEFIRIMPHVPEYGRWDDILYFVGVQNVRRELIQFVSGQLEDDYIQARRDGRPSLLAKWMPRVNASSYETRLFGREWAAALGYTERNYRQLLSMICARVGIVETLISSGQWDRLNYAAVPSQAMNLYGRRTFLRHDGARFRRYLAQVRSGQSRINAATLMPHEIIRRLASTNNNAVAIEQWNALPDYFAGADNANTLMVLDRSQSMRGDPMLVATALTLYACERNRGAFHNAFMSFSANPQFMFIPTHLRNVADKYRWIEQNIRGGYNTNLTRVFTRLLDTARENRVSAADMPGRIIIVSDMQFDQATGATRPPHVAARHRDTAGFDRHPRTNFAEIRQMYADAGYAMPQLIFWNVRAVPGTNPVTSDENGTMLVSGLNASIFQQVMSSRRELTPYEAMVQVLMNSRYSIDDRVE